MAIDLSNLTDAQRAAVTHIDGPLLILAGPGSGKTRVITHRIGNLLQHGVSAKNILALTFTNKAAEEMRSRVQQLVPGSMAWISTFHRFCSRLLREHASLVGLGENFTILDANDSKRALAHVLEGMDEVNVKQVTPAALLNAISVCKNNLVTPDAYRPSSRDSLAVMLAEIYPAYQRQLFIANAVDFDDLLLHTVTLLKNNEQVRRDFDQQFQFIMVDEYQDTNLAQYAIVRALSIDQPNLAVTGDPDQSIYAWRGANIQNILGFERDYPQVEVVRLEHNFRSTPEVLAVADELIRYNRQRKRKSLLPVRASQQPARLLAFPTQHDEARYIAETIRTHVEEGTRSFKDFAIFYRVNALSRYLEHTLREYDVPYQVLNGVEFYQRKEVKDVIAYLQLINNSHNDVAFLRVINTPPRGLGKVTIRKIADFARAKQVSLMDAAAQMGSQLSKRAANAVKEFTSMIDTCALMANSPVEEILGHVLSKSGYEDYVGEADERADEDRSGNIRELLSAARQFDMLHQGSDYLDAFLEQTSLVADTDAWEEEVDKVTLMTLHGSKGLEFPAVFMVAVEQGKLPHERSREDPSQLEEERRLMFVGITRAQDDLTISYAKYRDYRGQSAPTIPSSFLMELPRGEMHVVTPDSLSTMLASEDDPDAWDGIDDVYDDEELAEDALEFDPAALDGEDGEEEEMAGVPEFANVEASAITTAADLIDESDEPEVDDSPRANPESFVQGMRVKHPEYGLGKIVALSGNGTGRTATVNFVTAGEHSFVLAYSKLQPIAS